MLASLLATCLLVATCLLALVCASLRNVHTNVGTHARFPNPVPSPFACHLIEHLSSLGASDRLKIVKVPNLAEAGALDKVSAPTPAPTRALTYAPTLGP